MSHRALSRPMVLIAALLVGVALLVTVSVSQSRADSHTLPAADTIVLEIDDVHQRLVYGATEQTLAAGPSNCKLTTASVAGPIVSITATATDKKGNAVDPSPVGLVDDGLGTSEKGNGNGQDCGLVDEGESITLALTDQVGSRLIQSMSLDLEGKFGGGALVTYLLDGDTVGTDSLSLSSKGSDSGPDAREGDNYWFPNLPLAANAGILFDAIMIQPDPGLDDPGSVSLQGGGDFAVPEDHRTEFNLLAALDCGDSLETGGPFQDDDPLAHFFLGPTKDDGPCAVPIELTSSRTGGTEQTVNLAPPAGYSWDGIGVSGLLTIEWDVEMPDADPIDRTLVRTSDGDEVIPWCEDVIGYSGTGDGWSYQLDPEIRYPEATEGDLCLVDQSSETVFYDHDDDAGTDDLVWTQTTEIFYIWNDPLLVRK